MEKLDPTIEYPPEVSTRVLRSALIYLRERYGEQEMHAFVRKTGATVEFLKDENTWVSMQYIRRFLCALVDYTGDPRAPFDAGGKYAVHPEAWGMLHTVYLFLANPRAVYKRAIEQCHVWTRISKFEVIEMDSNRIRARYQDKTKGDPRYKITCLSRRGQLAGVPMAIGLPPAKVDQLECQFEGGEYCVYEISWSSKPTSLYPLLAAGSALPIMLLLHGMWPIGLASVALATACAYLLVRCLTIRSALCQNVDLGQEQHESLEKAVQTVQKKYDELVSAKQKVERLNAELERKVEQRTGELQAANERLRELDRLKTRFFANVGEDLRAPLAETLASAESMLKGQQGDLTPSLSSHMNMIYSNGLRLEKLINNLHDLTKLESGRLKLRFRRGDIGVFVKNLVQACHPTAEHRGIELTLEVQSTPPVHFDPDQIEKVLLNLVMNSLKFTEPGGSVRVEVEEGEDGVHLRVLDTGKGIPASEVERVFDRFAQLDSSASRRHEGAGLGLALARELVGLHGGRIWCESKEGHGTRMHVVLPKAVESPFRG